MLELETGTGKLQGEQLGYRRKTAERDKERSGTLETREDPRTATATRGETRVSLSIDGTRWLEHRLCGTHLITRARGRGDRC